MVPARVNPSRAGCQVAIVWFGHSPRLGLYSPPGTGCPDPMFIYLFSYFYQCGLGLFIGPDHHYLFRWNGAQFGHWKPLQRHKLGFVLLTCPPPLFFEHFLVFWPNKIVLTHLVLSQLQPWSQPFLQGALVLCSGWWYLETNIWEPGVLIAAEVSLPHGQISARFKLDSSLWWALSCASRDV